MPEENVFTVQELARYLKMKPVTIYKHAKEGKLPWFKFGANWRFVESLNGHRIVAQDVNDTRE